MQKLMKILTVTVALVGLSVSLAIPTNGIVIEAYSVTISDFSGYAPMTFSGIVKIGCERKYCLQGECPGGQVQDCDHCMYAQYILGTLVRSWWVYENCTDCRRFC